MADVDVYPEASFAYHTDILEGRKTEADSPPYLANGFDRETEIGRIIRSIETVLEVHDFALKGVPVHDIYTSKPDGTKELTEHWGKVLSIWNINLFKTVAYELVQRAGRVEKVKGKFVLVRRVGSHSHGN